MKFNYRISLAIRSIVTVIFTVLFLVFVFLFTNPNNVPLVLLIIPFILIGIIVYILSKLLIDLTSNHVQSRAVYYKLAPLSLSFAVVAILLLASLGQLTLKDGILVLGFSLLFLIYIVRVDFLR